MVRVASIYTSQVVVSTLLAVCLLQILVLGVLLCREARRKGRLSRWMSMSKIFEHLRSMLVSFVDCNCAQDSDVMKAQIIELVSKRRFQRIRLGVKVIWTFWLVMAVWIIFEIQWQDLWSDLPAEEAMYIVAVPCIRLMASFVFGFGPECILASCLNVICLALYAEMCLKAFFASELNPLDLFAQRHVRTAAQIIANFILGCPRLSAVGSIFLSCVEISSSCGTQCFDNAENRQYVVIETSILVVLVCLCFCSRYWQRSDARSAILTNAASQGETIARSLLSATCDVVVLLDPDRKIVSPAPKLAMMLMRHQSLQALEGVVFDELVCDDDLERMHEFLQSREIRGTDSDIAPTLHLNLKDALGNQVCVQIFVKSFSGIGGIVQHMLGIREIGETGRCVPSPDFAEGALASIAEGYVLDSNMRLPSLDSLSVTNSSRASVTAAGEVELVDALAEECVVLVDAFSRDLTILEWSVSFASLCGPSSRRVPFLRWIRGTKKRQEFLDWVHDFTNTVHYERCDSNFVWSQSQRRIRLQPAKMTPTQSSDGERHQVEYDAHCSLVAVYTQALPEEEDDQCRMILGISLRNVSTSRRQSHVPGVIDRTASTLRMTL
eukprot:TRINITY_DN33558_c0_g1_i1.p1 TRINITY_DN33558_c0_g1~~TRINITY_DN33558_c0_g1_i1.p1  ORF type:complete len:609 (+),score=67.36 TRINITY_DN33558_c0_g1_i1:86-1912(+)